MTDRRRVPCPECGAEMNFHAEKIDQSRSGDDPSFDAALGGTLREFHTCPACKFVLEREAR